jgi:hypothetical protein
MKMGIRLARTTPGAVEEVPRDEFPTVVVAGANAKMTATLGTEDCLVVADVERRDESTVPLSHVRHR